MEFRRFVSYMYAYRENVKQRNCGFVRVEIRQNIVRILVHMSLPDKRGVEYKVYGFWRNGEELDGILLGMGTVRNGSVDIRLQMRAEHMGLEDDNGQRSVSIDNLDGMIVVSSDFCRYATVWDDGELAISGFQEYRRKPVREEYGEQTKAAQIEAESTTNEKSEENGMSEAVTNLATADLGAADDMAEDTVTASDATANDRITAAQEDQGSAQAKQNTEMQSADYETDWAEEAEQAVAEDRQFSQENHEMEDPDWWIQLKNICSKITPFGEETNGFYIRIEPKELKYLPPQLWFLGRNSFLLHGYYSYRYLILGRTNEGWLLGVPGTYFPMEEGVAAMFGFNRFYSAPKQSNQRGRFGFWCRRIL